MTAILPPAANPAGPQPLLVIDMQRGLIIDANDAAVAFYGYPRERLVGMGLDAISLEAGEAAFGLTEAPLRGTSFPARHRLATGEERSVVVRVDLAFEGGRLLARSRILPFTGALPDALPVDPDAARRYRDLVEHLGSGLAIFGPLGEIGWVNATMASLLGGTATEVLARYEELFPAESVDAWCTAVQALHEGTDTVTMDLPVRRLDGAELLLEVHARLLPGGAVEAVAHDVTARRAAEAALAASEERNRALVDQAFDGIVLVGPDGRVQHANPTACEILGVAPGDLETIAELERNAVHQASAEDREASRRRLLAGETVTGDAVVRRPDGRVIVIEQRARRRADGTTLAVLRDVTAARKAHLALAHSEARSRELVETAEDIVLVTDASGHINYANPALERLLGRPLETLIGSPGIDLIDPRDRGLVQGAWPAVIAGGTSRFEARILRPDGAALWAEARVHRLPSGEIETIARDITRRKAAEAERDRLIQALDQSTDAVILTDLDGVASYANPAFLRISGWDREAVLGRPASEWFRSQATGREGFDRIAAGVLADGAWSGDLHSSRPDGSPVVASVRIALVRDADGEPAGFLGIATDVTWERAQTERLGATAQVEAIAQLSAAIAHDFNNLLTGVLGYAQLAQSAPADDPALAANLRQIVDQAQRSEQLTRRLMAFGRQARVEPQDLEPAAAVRATEPALRRIAGDRVDIVIDAADTGARVRVDPGLLEIALIAVVENARDAMPDGGTIRISVGGAHAAETPPAGDWAVIRVRDDGPGIPPDILARLADPLPAIRSERGVNLGLPMVSGFLLQSRGHLRVTSSPAGGTIVALYLPITTPAAPTQAAGAAGGGPVAEATAPGRRVVLVVDDEPVLRTIAERVLVLAGYDVLVAASGEEALAIAIDPGVRVDLLFTDIVMPGIHGPALATALLATRPGLRVLVTSGFAPDDADRAGLGLGGLPFLPKPYTPADLTAAVGRVLGGLPA